MCTYALVFIIFDDVDRAVVPRKRFSGRVAVLFKKNMSNSNDNRRNENASRKRDYYGIADDCHISSTRVGSLSIYECTEDGEVAESPKRQRTHSYKRDPTEDDGYIPIELSRDPRTAPVYSSTQQLSENKPSPRACFPPPIKYMDSPVDAKLMSMANSSSEFLGQNQTHSIAPEKDRTIFVSGFDSYDFIPKHTMLAKFREFGDIESYKFCSSFMFITYAREHSAHAAVERYSGGISVNSRNIYARYTKESKHYQNHVHNRNSTALIIPPPSIPPPTNIDLLIETMHSNTEMMFNQIKQNERRIETLERRLSSTRPTPIVKKKLVYVIFSCKSDREYANMVASNIMSVCDVVSKCLEKADVVQYDFKMIGQQLYDTRKVCVCVFIRSDACTRIMTIMNCRPGIPNNILDVRTIGQLQDYIAKFA
jgi:hypothetical protein